MYTIELKSLDQKSLIIYQKFIYLIFKKLNIIFGSIYLPKKVKKITLLKSPHVYKKSKEQFQIVTFKVLIKIKSDINFRLINYILVNKSSLIKLKLIRGIV